MAGDPRTVWMPGGVRTEIHLAGEDTGARAQAARLVTEPAVLEPAEQRVCLLHERGRVGDRLGVDFARERLGPVGGVHEPLDVAAEPEPEQDVVLGGAHPGGAARCGSESSSGSGTRLSSAFGSERASTASASSEP